MTNQAETLIEAKGIKKHFPVTKGVIFMKQVGAIQAVDGIDFTIERGETFGLVESPAVARPRRPSLFCSRKKQQAAPFCIRERILRKYQVPS